LGVDNHVTNDELIAKDRKEKETDHVIDSEEQRDVEKNGIVEPEGKKTTEGNGADDSIMKSMQENSPTIHQSFRISLTLVYTVKLPL